MTRHVNMMSGGLFSWATGRRVANRHGTDNLVHLFTDTRIEDADLYRFLPEAVEDVGGELIWIAEGRTPWQVFNDEGMIGNTQADICSRILKRDLADKWLAENCDPGDTIIYVGIGWDEAHRFDNGEGGGAKNRYARLGWRCEAPMIEPPYLSKDDLVAELWREQIAPPRLYAEGFPHNNCGGACIKAGQGQWAHLLRVRPAVYAEWENEETAFRERTGKDVAILRDRRGGTTRPLPLREFRLHIQRGGQFDLFDIGGCGCFIDDSDGPPAASGGPMSVPEIHNEPCACPPDHCAHFIEPAAHCINRLSGEVVTKPCPVCHPTGNGSTWHHNGACLACKHKARLPPGGPGGER